MSIFGISTLSIIPVRAEPSDKSEMVTQILFGETYQILEESEKWLKIKINFDSYQGWIDKIQHTSVNDKYYNEYQNQTHSLLFRYSTIVSQNNVFYPILLGSTLPFYSNGQININNQLYAVDNFANNTKSVKETAFLFFNAPYLWGGKTPFGIDCSGFTQQVFKLNGVPLLRDASMQITQGVNVDLHKVKEGDLAFFTKNDKIVHVGILLENNHIIHAHGKVRVDVVDEKGIYNKDQKKYTHFLHSVRRYF